MELIIPVKQRNSNTSESHELAVVMLQSPSDELLGQLMAVITGLEVLDSKTTISNPTLRQKIYSVMVNLYVYVIYNACKIMYNHA